MVRTHTLNRNRFVLLAILAMLLTLATAVPSADAVLVGDPVGPILVVAPHPDDDVITTAGITYSRSDVTIAFMTNSDTDPVGPSVRQDEAVAAQAILGQPESKLIFLGYPDAALQEVWKTSSGSYPSNGYTETFAEHGLGMTDWHDYRMGPGEQHAPYNRPAMVADMVALIEYVRPAHIFTTSEFDAHPDHSATFNVIDEALSTVTASDPSYGVVLHETIVWHPDSGLWGSWPQDRNAAVEIAHDVSLGASPSIESVSSGRLAWDQREQFYIPDGWPGMGDSNPKAQAIDAHAGQGGLGGFIGRFVHRDEIFWADYINYPVLSINDITVTEGATASFTVSRAGATGVEVAVTATTSNGSATAPGDYTAKSQQVTLGVGVASASFSVATTEDTAGEPAETFSVTLSSPTAGATLGDATGTGTINDDDAAALSIDTLDGLSVTEDGGSDSYRLALTAQPTATVTVTVSPDSQLIATPGSLTFTTANWDVPQTVTVEAVDDSVAEPDPHTGTIAHTTASSDPAYDGLGPVERTAEIEENLTLRGPTAAAIGETLNYSADTGATEYTWTVTRNGSQVATGTNPTLSFTPTEGGNHNVTLTVTAGGVASSPASLPLSVLADIAGSTFVDDIIWLADNGITAGCNPPTNDQFCPDKRVTRGQMAAFLVRALGLTDDGGGNSFTDDDGSVFEGDIAKLAAAGITAGCNPPANSKFCPEANVTRGQMAAFLRRASNLS